MKKTKINLSLFSILFVIWIGLLFTRIIISSDLISNRAFEIIPPENSVVEFTYYKIIAKIISLNLILYPLTIILGAIFLFFKKYSLKDNPWLTTIVIIFIFFIPIELYFAKIDYDFLWLGWNNSQNLNEYRDLFLKRIALLSGIQFVMILCYLTILPLIIFKPFKKSDERN